MSTKSQQGVLGKQVTVKAQVTVEDGQSKAGIPVTFNIAGDATGLTEPVKVEVVTDANGVASYSYTRYVDNTDYVTAYATGAPAKYDAGYVYWSDAEQLTIKADTKDLTVANGKTIEYDIDTTLFKNGYVLVAFKENLNVEPDEVEDGAYLTDAFVVKSDKLSSDVNKESYSDLKEDYAADVDAEDVYPYQAKSSDYQYAVVEIKDYKGTFTVSGANASITPIVYQATSTGKWSATALQAEAATAKFEEKSSMKLTVEAKGVQNAAAIDADDHTTLRNNDTIDLATAYNLGGRDYVATLKDEDGDTVGKGTKVSVVVPEDKLSAKKSVYLIDADGNVKLVDADEPIELSTDKNGQVSFTLVGENAGYATPTVFYDNGKKDGELDKSDLQTVGEKVYFKAATVTTGALSVLDADSDAVSSVGAGEDVHFVYQSVDQNGKAYVSPSAGEYEATFTVSAKTSDVVVTDVDGNELATVAAGKSKVVTIDSKKGKAEVVVTSASKGSADVKVATTSPKLTTITKSVKFNDSSIIGSKYTGLVTDLNTTKRTIKLDTKEALKYSNSDKFFDEDDNDISRSKFETLVTNAINAGLDVKVKFEEGKDANTFTIVEIEKGASTDANLTQYLLAKEAVTGLTATDYTSSSWADLQSALTSNDVTTANTQAEVDAATTSINNAKTALKSAVSVSANNLTLTFDTVVQDAALTVNVGTVSVDTEGASVAAGDFDSETGELVITFTDASSAAVANGDAISVPVTVNGETSTLKLVYNNSVWSLENGPVTIR
ncbi:hypothetical protein FOA22_03360 [Heyndrickxia oleronia]|uniref:hypothetical protein n=1 Tax=Heyndrickxia oleronia TaxID=38875 RepID=UPI003339B9A4